MSPWVHRHPGSSPDVESRAVWTPPYGHSTTPLTPPSLGCLADSPPSRHQDRMRYGVWDSGSLLLVLVSPTAYVPATFFTV